MNNSDIRPNIKENCNMGEFRMWCQKVIPLVYDDSMSYYELLCKVVEHLNEIGNELNLTNEEIEKLIEWIKENGSTYELPVATEKTLGGVRIKNGGLESLLGEYVYKDKDGKLFVQYPSYTGSSAGVVKAYKADGNPMEDNQSVQINNGFLFPRKATSSKYGVVKAEAKGPEDTVQAKIGDDGKLYVPKYPEGGGTGGTTDYADLTNKPQINGHELNGNHTAEQLDIIIPTVLPNPHRLLFTGGATGEYNGSEDVTINIPTGSGGSNLIAVDFYGLGFSQEQGIDKGTGQFIKADYEKIKPLREHTGSININFKSGKYLVMYKSSKEGSLSRWSCVTSDVDSSYKRFYTYYELAVSTADTDVFWKRIVVKPSGGGVGKLEPLTFTGGATGEYDGTKPLTVDIPTGGGGGEKPWKKLLDKTFLEQASRLEVTLDDNGQPINCTEMIMQLNSKFTETNSGYVYVKDDDGKWVNIWDGLLSNTTTEGRTMLIKIEKITNREMWFCSIIENSNTGDTNLKPYEWVRDGKLSSYHGVQFACRAGNFQENAHLQIWGK